MNATVGDVMTTRVIAVKRSADYKEICSVLRQYGVSACPVINDAGKVVGVVSEADLLYKVADPDPPSGLIRLRWKLGEESKVNAITAGQLMTSPAVSIQPDAPVAVAARVMQDRRVRRLPVVGPDGMLIGIVSRTDLLSVYERPDGDIRDEVLREIIAGEFGLDPAEFEVTVSSGVVTLAGRLARLDTALALLGRVRHAEGVVAVRDRLIVAGTSGNCWRLAADANAAPGSGQVGPFGPAPRAARSQTLERGDDDDDRDFAAHWRRLGAASAPVCRDRPGRPPARPDHPAGGRRDWNDPGLAGVTAGLGPRGCFSRHRRGDRCAGAIRA